MIDAAPSELHPVQLLTAAEAEAQIAQKASEKAAANTAKELEAHQKLVDSARTRTPIV